MAAKEFSAQTRQFVLGLDLDGVCGDYTFALRQILAEKRGVSPDELPLEITWNYPEWLLTQAEYMELHKEAVMRHNIFSNMPVIDGASEALWELSDSGVWIRIITHRLLFSQGHQQTARDTAEWLDKNNIPYRELCFVGMKTEVGADLYIDDSPKNVNALRGTGKKVVVFEQPYNRHLESPRAKNWDEALPLIQKMIIEEQGRLANPLPGINIGSNINAET